MRTAITTATLFAALVAGAVPVAARVCENSHGRAFHCHHVLAPRINLKDRHPVKVMRCRGHVGKFNNCR